MKAKPRERHRLAGCTVRIKSGKYIDRLFEVEDWQQNVMGKSWMFLDGTPCGLSYAIRVIYDDLPMDNNVLYGEIGHLGVMIHESEIGEVMHEKLTMATHGWWTASSTNTTTQSRG